MGKKKDGPRILVWDIESTNLNATFGTILCIGYKWIDKPKVHVPTILEHSKNGMLDDRGLVEEFARVYNEADYTTAHYGVRFDLPMIKTKLLKYGLPPLPPKPLIDTWWVARRELRLHSNRLATIAEFLGVKHAKTPIIFDDWLKAAHGDKKALKSVVHHCKMDVLVLEEVFLRLRPLMKEEPPRILFASQPSSSAPRRTSSPSHTRAATEPDLSSVPTCPSCGSLHMQSRGLQVAKTRRYSRYQCQGCGKWSRSRQAVHGYAPVAVSN